MNSNSPSTVSGFAKIRYLRYEQKSIVDVFPISSIKYKDCNGAKELRVPFAPKSFVDFCSKSLYVLKTDKDSTDGKEHNYFCQIGMMAGTIQELESSKRLSWHVHGDILSDPETTDAEDKLDGRSAFVTEKNNTKQNYLLKQKAHRAQLQTFVQNEEITPRVITEETDPPVSKILLMTQLAAVHEEMAKLRAAAHEEMVQLRAKLALAEARPKHSNQCVSVEMIKELSTQIKSMKEQLEVMAKERRDSSKCLSPSYQRVQEWLNTIPTRNV